MTRRANFAIPALTAALLVAAAGPVAAQPTTARTIADADGDNRLEYAPGESHVVRQDLAPADAKRAKRRVQRYTFAQFTDSHVLDEESPLRVEYTDKLGPPLTSAYRPQEGLTTQVQNQMVRQVRDTASPVFGRRAQAIMTTGDNTDDTQLNETRWFIDLLDGGATVDPNSGVPGTCGTAATGRPLYDGVRGGNEYYEPDASGPSGPASVDGPGYSPVQSENKAEAQRSNQVRDYPGLFEAMNRPFRATGLGVPWYGIFGNHDALVEGNQPRNPSLEAVATGCVKVTQPSPATLAGIKIAQAQAPIAQEELLPGLNLALQDAASALADPANFGGTSVVVPRDDRRRPLKKAEYISEHFKTGGSPVGHGFTARNVAEGMGNYAFSPTDRLRFVVLDSIAETGGSDGNIDDEQFQWIHQQLLEAERRRQVVFAFSHHSLRTMDQAPAVPSGDQGGNTSPNVHFGEKDATGKTACPSTSAAAPTTTGETLRCLFLRHPSVVGSVVGHEHLSRIAPIERQPDAGPAGGFWEITTASHIDWPQQSRLIDLADNRDGTLSIFGTVLDHASAPNPGDGAATGASVARLGSISRELSFNDPQADNGEDGRADARGTRYDRNVELLVRNPYPGGD